MYNCKIKRSYKLLYIFFLNFNDKNFKFLSILIVDMTVYVILYNDMATVQMKHEWIS